MCWQHPAEKPIANFPNPISIPNEVLIRASETHPSAFTLPCEGGYIAAGCLADASARKASILSTIRGGHLHSSLMISDPSVYVAHSRAALQRCIIRVCREWRFCARRIVVLREYTCGCAIASHGRYTGCSLLRSYRRQSSTPTLLLPPCPACHAAHEHPSSTTSNRLRIALQTGRGSND